MSRKQSIFILLVVAVSFVMAVTVASYGARPKVVPETKSAEALLKEKVARGQYLVTIGGCNDCHTPWIMGEKGPEPDMTRSLSGHPQDFVIEKPAQLEGDRFAWAGAPTNTAFSGPWGVSFAANLTPDEMTGTGIWTEDIFRNTIRNGRHWGVARPLLPPMPWFNYREMTDEDLSAVFTYIRTLTPVRNEVPEPLPPAERKS